MSKVIGIMLGVAIMAAGVANAEENQFELHYNPFLTVTNDFAEASHPTFRETFKLAFNENVTETFADRFNPLSVMSWKLEFEDRSYHDFREDVTSRVRNTMSRSVLNGLREAAVQLPVMDWLAEHQQTLAEFVWDSVDAVNEESVAPQDINFGLAERSWWKRVENSQRMRFGVRPLRTDPYAFVSTTIKEGDHAVLLGHMRYRYRNFAEHRFELAMSMPMVNGISVDLGTAYKVGDHDGEGSVVMKLFKEFKSGGIAHIGFEVREKPSFFAGISIPM